ncbi:MAG TPA: FAD-dependent thymidylate synthase [Candidatus Limnocylindria bacterium]|nr:FAD-dependent thymidylate synthase [Candidatus Limnocylindria bacterium]
MTTEPATRTSAEAADRLTGPQRAEIDALRDQSARTRRATVPALEELLYAPIPVLDHGFVRVIDYMGDDGAVVQAARVSYGSGTKKKRDDAGLIRYLMRHRHTSPFEMCELKVHLKMPIFVARQHARHRVASINETSGRYSILDREFYIPRPEDLGKQSTGNRQGRGETLDHDQALAVLDLLKEDAARAYRNYERLVGDDTPDGEGGFGLARELARMNLSVNLYTQMYWKIDLHNLLHYLSLRADAHAQYEIRVFAEALLDVVRRWVPLTYEAFMDYRMGGVQLSAAGLAVVKRLARGERVDQQTSGMSPGEWRELMETLGL